MLDSGALIPLREVRDPYSDDIDLRGYVQLFWKHKVAIAGTALVFAALAAIVGLTTRRTYEAEAVLAINPSKIGATQAATPTTTASYRPILESHNLAATIIREFGLDSRGYSASTFFGSVVTIDEVKNATVFILRAQLDDPNLAARVVNRTVELAVEESRRLNQDEALRSRDDIKTQLDDARTRMDRAAEAVLTFKNSSQIELLRKDVDSRLQERGDLLTLLVQIEAEKAKLAAAERELANRPRLDTVKRSIDSDPALMESARRRVAGSDNVLGLQIEDQSINVTYQELDSEIADAKTTLAGLERRKQQLVDVRKLNAPQLAELTHLYNAESELSRLQMEADVARKVYEQVATAYQTARLQVASRSAELQLIEPALPPDRPLSRHIGRNAGIAFFVGLLLSVVMLLAYDSIRTTPIR